MAWPILLTLSSILLVVAALRLAHIAGWSGVNQFVKLLEVLEVLLLLVVCVRSCIRNLVTFKLNPALLLLRVLTVTHCCAHFYHFLQLERNL